MKNILLLVTLTFLSVSVQAEPRLTYNVNAQNGQFVSLTNLQVVMDDGSTLPASFENVNFDLCQASGFGKSSGDRKQVKVAVGTHLARIYNSSTTQTPKLSFRPDMTFGPEVVDTELYCRDSSRPASKHYSAIGKEGEWNVIANPYVILNDGSSAHLVYEREFFFEMSARICDLFGFSTSGGYRLRTISTYPFIARLDEGTQILSLGPVRGKPEIIDLLYCK